MSRLRFANIPTPTLPPAGRTFLYVDETDSHAKTIDSSGTIFDLTLSGGGGGGVDTDTISDALLGVDGITVISGANITTVSGFRAEFISTSGSLQTQINNNTAQIITTSGHLQVQIDNITASDVESVNSLTGAIDVIGKGEVNVTVEGQNIVVSGTPHETDTDTDTISDAIIGGTGITVTSGSNTTTIDGHLRYTKDENDAIVAGSNVTVVSGANTITISSTGGGGGGDVPDALVGAGTVTVTSGTNTTTISGSTALTGLLHQIAFMKGKTIENDVFLNTYGDGGDGSPSNESPAVMPWKSKLVGLSYTNKVAGTKVHIEVQSVADGSGNSPVLMDFDWLLDAVGVRTARKTNFTTDIIFDAGDKIAVFIRSKSWRH